MSGGINVELAAAQHQAFVESLQPKQTVQIQTGPREKIDG